jgi:excisionase family DNA binding protein
MTTFLVRPSPDDPFLTAQELSTMLRVSLSTVYRWNWQKSGPPFYKARGRLRYRASDVERWLQERRSREEGDDDA